MGGVFALGFAAGAFMVAQAGEILAMPDTFKVILTVASALLIGIIFYEAHVARGDYDN